MDPLLMKVVKASELVSKAFQVCKHSNCAHQRLKMLLPLTYPAAAHCTGEG